MKCKVFGLSVIVLVVALLGVVRQINLTGTLTGTFVFAEMDDLSGKVFVVTGANSGIGKSTAMGLVMNNGSVVMACRSEKKCEVAREEILKEIGKDDVVLECMKLDLSSFESISSFVEEFKKRFERLDVLVNNAGVVTLMDDLTADGLGLIWGVNHFGVFKLTGELLPFLLESKGRIVVVASHGHNVGTVDFNDFDMSGANYQNVSIIETFRIYCSSKLGSILFTLELSKKLKDTGVTVNSLGPGYVTSDMSREIPSFLSYAYKVIELLLAKTSWEGAQTTLHLAGSKEVANISGAYFRNCAPFELTHPMFFDITAELLWTESEKITGTVYKFHN